MIRTQSIEPVYGSDITPDLGREVNHTDPEVVRLLALNLELAIKNLVRSKSSPECLVLTADICTHKLMAMPTADGDIKVLVFES
ncbi:MAG: hypothetical protein GQ580_01325 [Candidatus Thorarchaeota archaeon]|nr:hypothetical protein [Candidatus Thorarchaeota archaeon]